MIVIEAKADKLTRYALRHRETGELAAVDKTFNEPGENVNISHKISAYGDETWLVEGREWAERVLTTDTGWYNADYQTPEWGWQFVPAQWEVVAVEMQIVIRSVERMSS